MRFKLAIAALLGSSLFAYQSMAAEGTQDDVSMTLITTGQLVDTEAGRVLSNQMILVENDTIKAIGTKAKMDSLDLPDGITRKAINTERGYSRRC